jgi:hypothetical protein
MLRLLVGAALGLAAYLAYQAPHREGASTKSARRDRSRASHPDEEARLVLVASDLEFAVDDLLRDPLELCH